MPLTPMLSKGQLYIIYIKALALVNMEAEKSQYSYLVNWKPRREIVEFQFNSEGPTTRQAKGVIFIIV